MGETPVDGELAGENCPDCGSALLVAPDGARPGGARGYCPRCDHMHPLRAP